MGLRVTQLIRRHLRHGLFIVSIAVFPVLAGCSSSLSSNQASAPSSQNVAEWFGGQRSHPELVQVPPPQNVAVAPAVQPGAMPVAGAAPVAAVAPTPLLPPGQVAVAQPGVPPGAGQMAAVQPGVPPAPGQVGNTAAGPVPVAPAAGQPAAGKTSLYDELSSDTWCSMPSDPRCDSTQRVSN